MTFEKFVHTYTPSLNKNHIYLTLKHELTNTIKHRLVFVIGKNEYDRFHINNFKTFSLYVNLSNNSNEERSLRTINLQWYHKENDIVNVIDYQLEFFMEFVTAQLEENHRLTLSSGMKENYIL